MSGPSGRVRPQRKLITLAQQPLGHTFENQQQQRRLAGWQRSIAAPACQVAHLVGAPVRLVRAASLQIGALSWLDLLLIDWRRASAQSL